MRMMVRVYNPDDVSKVFHLVFDDHDNGMKTEYEVMKLTSDGKGKLLDTEKLGVVRKEEMKRIARAS